MVNFDVILEPSIRKFYYQKYMQTKTVASIVLIVGLSALIFLNSNSMANNRYEPSQSSQGDAQNPLPESWLRANPRDTYPTISEPLSELQTEIVKESDSEDNSIVEAGDTITVNYTGWLASNGNVFDSSLNPGRTPFSFTVGSGVIEGWSLGVVGMKIGEVRLLKIPSELGYGEFDQGTIPANSDLFFDVELLAIN